jgi:hypothetical protein
MPQDGRLDPRQEGGQNSGHLSTTSIGFGGTTGVA